MSLQHVKKTHHFPDPFRSVQEYSSIKRYICSVRIAMRAYFSKSEQITYCDDCSIIYCASCSQSIVIYSWLYSKPDEDRVVAGTSPSSVGTTCCIGIIGNVEYFYNFFFYKCRILHIKLKNHDLAFGKIMTLKFILENTFILVSRCLNRSS